MGRTPRRPGRPAAGQRPLRRRVLDARDDGHRPQPRPQRRSRSGASPPAPRSASPSTPTAASCRCTAASCSTSPARPFDDAARAGQGRPRRGHRRRAPAEALEAPGRAVQGRHRGRTPARRSRRTRRPSSAARSRPCSAAGQSPRAQAYRRRERIPDDLGTAVNVQAMVFGNRDDRSGTGVAFTRNPSTGATGAYGDFLINAQGEDVVAGIRATDARWRRWPTPSRRLTPSCVFILERHRGPLPRHARLRVHDRARPPLDAPDPRGQAHRRGRHAHRRRHDRRPARSA